MRARIEAARADSGFTLVELLIVIALMSVLMGALGMAFSVMMSQTAATQTRMEVSHDAQLATAYFAEDVAGTGVRDATGNPLQSIETNAPSTGGLHPCGSPSLPNATVRLAWDEVTFGAEEVRTRVVVSYVVVQAGPERQLHRVVCRTTPAPASPAAATPVVDQVVVHNLSATTAPALSCSSSCTAASPPKRVSLTLTIRHPDDPEQLAVTLTGQRRQT